MSDTRKCSAPQAEKIKWISKILEFEFPACGEVSIGVDAELRVISKTAEAVDSFTINDRGRVLFSRICFDEKSKFCKDTMDEKRGYVAVRNLAKARRFLLNSEQRIKSLIGQLLEHTYKAQEEAAIFCRDNIAKLSPTFDEADEIGSILRSYLFQSNNVDVRLYAVQAYGAIAESLNFNERYQGLKALRPMMYRDESDLRVRSAAVRVYASMEISR